LVWRKRTGWIVEDDSSPGRLVFRSDLKVVSVIADQGVLLQALATIDDDRLVPGEPARRLLVRMTELGILSDAPATPNDALQAYFDAIGIDYRLAVDALLSARVLVIGLGGVGSVVLEHLLACGIGAFTLVDYDTVTESNLSRQFIYDWTSVGRMKVEAAADYIRRRIPRIEIETAVTQLNTGIDLENLLESVSTPSLVALCIDHPVGGVLDMFGPVLASAQIPFIHSGVGVSTGYVGPVHGHEFRATTVKAVERGEPAPTAACFPPFNTMVAAAMSSQILHFLVGAHDRVERGTRLFYDFKNHSSSRLDDSKCKEK
jgi:hypothetical protein